MPFECLFWYMTILKYQIETLGTAITNYSTHRNLIMQSVAFSLHSYDIELMYK